MSEHTFPRTWSTLEPSSDDALSPAQLNYFRERMRNRIHEAVLRKFLAQSETGLTRAKLAKRLRKRPEQITRWLGAPGNWTLETVSDLLLAMNAELDFEVAEWGSRHKSNVAHSSICSALALSETGSAPESSPRQHGSLVRLLQAETSPLLEPHAEFFQTEQPAHETLGNIRITTGRSAERQQKRGAVALAYSD